MSVPSSAAGRRVAKTNRASSRAQVVKNDAQIEAARDARLQDRSDRRADESREDHSEGIVDEFRADIREGLRQINDALSDGKTAGPPDTRGSTSGR